MICIYLELMIVFFWSKLFEYKEVDLDEVEKILNEDYFGLDKIKKWIL